MEQNSKFMKKFLVNTLRLNRELYKSELQINQFGSASIRYKNLCYIKPSGADLQKINYKNISVVEINSGKLFSGLKPSVDLNIHLSIYKKYKLQAWRKYINSSKKIKFITI